MSILVILCEDPHGMMLRYIKLLLLIFISIVILIGSAGLQYFLVFIF